MLKNKSQQDKNDENSEGKFYSPQTMQFSLHFNRSGAIIIVFGLFNIMWCLTTLSPPSIYQYHSKNIGGF